MDRLFLDANILLSAAYNPSSSLRQLWSLANTELFSSPFAIQEATNNLALARPAQLPELTALLAGVKQVPDPPATALLPAGITLPDKDRPILLYPPTHRRRATLRAILRQDCERCAHTPTRGLPGRPSGDTLNAQEAQCNPCLHKAGSTLSIANTSSHQAAVASNSASAQGRPTSWIASGKPSGLRPAGIDTVGRPV